MRAAARFIKKRVADIYWDLRGPQLSLPAVPPDPKSLLFVCKGNICRSPFAEYLARRIQEEGYATGVQFQSAGLAVSKPIPSPNIAIETAKPFGVMLDRHRSKPLSERLVAGCDMVIAMEGWQYVTLRELFPGHHGRMFLLPQLAPEQATGYMAFNIQDPYGGPREAFEDCFNRICRCLKIFLTSIH